MGLRKKGKQIKKKLLVIAGRKGCTELWGNERVYGEINCDGRRLNLSGEQTIAYR